MIDMSMVESAQFAAIRAPRDGFDLFALGHRTKPGPNRAC